MAGTTDFLKLERLHLLSGQGRRLEPAVGVDAVQVGGQRYVPEPADPAAAGEPLPALLDLSRTVTGGWALRLRVAVALEGPCVRCLSTARPRVDVDAREVHEPRGGAELTSPYVEDERLDLRAWTRDALVLALPPQLLCRPDCAGLCPQCGADLNEAGPDHAHEPEPDPRWAKLRELRFD